MKPVEIVKSMYAAFSRGDIDGVMTHVADDVVWSAEGPAEISFLGVRHGKTETMAFFAGIAEEHGDPKLEMTEFVAEGDSVAAFGRYEVTLKKTGARVNSPVAHLFKFRDGKVAHYTNMLNTAAFLPPRQTTKGIAISFTPSEMSAAQYDEIIQKLTAAGALPSAGFSHVCYGEAGKLRVLDVWPSMEVFQAFAKTLLPIIESAGVEKTQPEVLPVHFAAS
jgi:ketosteroid isomerase-like protein